MPDPRAELFAAMEGRTKPKPRSSKRPGRQGRVNCTTACPPKPDRCKCEWGCYRQDGARSKKKHIRLGLDWECPLEHSEIPGEVKYRKQVVAKRKARQALRDDPTIVRPMNGGTS